MSIEVTVRVAPSGDGATRLLAPVGLPTPQLLPVAFEVSGGTLALTGEATTGQMAALITASPDAPVVLRYHYAEGGPGYPEALYKPHRNRFTIAAEALECDAINTADAAGGGPAAIRALVNAAADKFRYAHPERRFNDGCEEVPYLACGLTEGSCVDINTYLIASLRAAGFEAGYVTGYFFPEEKNGACDDGHCWVVTRHGGEVLEWDIAHHLKLGTREIRPGLNPKPGTRVAVAHSMGLCFPDLGLACEKLLNEPVWLGGDGRTQKADITIRRAVTSGTIAAE